MGSVYYIKIGRPGQLTQTYSIDLDETEVDNGELSYYDVLREINFVIHNNEIIEVEGEAVGINDEFHAAPGDYVHVIVKPGSPLVTSGNTEPVAASHGRNLAESVRVQVGRVPGRMQDVMIFDATVRGALEAAEITPGLGETISVDSNTATLDTAVHSGSVVILSKQVKGN